MANIKEQYDFDPEIDLDQLVNDINEQDKRALDSLLMETQLTSILYSLNKDQRSDLLQYAKGLLSEQADKDPNKEGAANDP